MPFSSTIIPYKRLILRQSRTSLSPSMLCQQQSPAKEGPSEAPCREEGRKRPNVIPLGDDCKALLNRDESEPASQRFASAGVNMRSVKALAVLGMSGIALAMAWNLQWLAPLAKDAVNSLRRTTPPAYTPPKPLKQRIKHVSKAPVSRKRKGSFIVVGDWGYDGSQHGNVNLPCQRAIADLMNETFYELGDVQFIVNVGDSFYPGGVTSKWDSQWDTKWRNMYPPELRTVPWYSVYGNHDYHQDPCACADDAAECAQVNSNISDLDYFYMPGYNWHKEHPELDLEVVALDMNHYMWAWLKKTPDHSKCMWDCQYTPCPDKCSANMEKRAREAELLFHQRYSESSARNLLVFSHYPTDYYWSRPEFLDALSNASTHHVEFFGGHRHNTDQGSTTSISPNNNWLVGGGGGWSCDPPDVEGVPVQQGFVVGKIHADSHVTTHGVFVDSAICCPLPLKPWGPDPVPNWKWPPRCKK